MKKGLLYISIGLLYLMTPFCIMGTLGTMVNLKYEVHQRYWLIDGNDNLTTEQKQKKVNELYDKGRQLEFKAYAFAFVSFATFVTATVLIIKRKKILGEWKAPTQ